MCRHKDCSVYANLSISSRDTNILHITWHGTVKHSIAELKTQNVTASRRLNLKKKTQFCETNASPSKVHEVESMKINPEEYMVGKRDPSTSTLGTIKQPSKIADSMVPNLRLSIDKAREEI